MAKPENYARLPTFSKNRRRFYKPTIIAILFICVCVAIADFMTNDERLNIVALLIFFILAIVGFSSLILWGAGVLSPTAQLQSGQNFSSLELLDDAILLTNASGYILKSNASGKNIVGGQSAKTLFQLLSDIHDAEQVIYRLNARALSGQNAQEELRVTKPLWPVADGHAQSWYSLSVRPIKSGKNGCLLWRLQDISFAHEMHEPLFRDLQEAINHLDQAPAGFLSLDTNGSFLYLNATLSNWLHIDIATFKIGQLHFDEVFETASEPATWLQLKNNIEQSREYYQFSIVLKGDGEKVDTFNVCATTQPDDDNDEKIYRLVLVPVAHSADMLHALATTKDIFHAYFKNAPLAMAIINQQGKFLVINRPFSHLFNITSDDTENRLLFNVMADGDKTGIEGVLRKIAANGLTNLAIEATLSSDKNRHFRLFFVGIANEQRSANNEIAILSVVETTAQKTLEDKMAQGQKLQAVGQLAGGIAHDFNNVLTAILMSCDLLLASHRSSDPAHADLINIKNNANRAASLVQQLLAFSRRQTLRPEVVDLTELLSDVRNLLMPLLGSNIHLKFNHGRDLWDVKVDQASFQRVLMNLVINGRDAMASGGTITITTANVKKQQIDELSYSGLVSGDYVELDVEDTGTGIPKAVQEKMFEPFFTTKEVGKGTGLGLSMVYGIVKQTGGYIYCESHEGKGTKFRIFLPRFVADSKNIGSDDRQKVQQTKSQPEKSEDLSGTATVLLVEDEAAVRMGGVRALQSRGYTVLEAENGLEALDIIGERNGAVDLVVSDVVMPEMDGPTLLGEMRKKYPEIKFVFVSGYAKDAFAKNLAPDAVFGFLSKPFTLKQLAMKVKEMLDDSGVVN
ncbi:PAS domain-containing sensor histidine kinase [uncultured Bartonella sp.]|uniref:PAS domain-containing sensor histidine kinase n=1 Tax=uncultured Bartonella sp. TaxID=104108 RepID=UPI0026158CA3|nr:PAS domain-containing sensor histidine kinase [uncultured Bartonella sp.]